jgi:hypothetical protein
MTTHEAASNFDFLAGQDERFTPWGDGGTVFSTTRRRPD